MTRKPKKTMPRSPVAKDGDIGALIRVKRNELKMSQQSLAEILGVSFQQVQKYEKGVNRVGASRLAEIAKALKMQPEDFFAVAADGTVADASSIIDVNSADTLRMIRAYTRIKDQATQRQMVVLVETIAAASDTE